MSTHMVISRARHRNYDQLADFASRAQRNHAIKCWTATQKFKTGDRALFYFSQISSIVAVGTVSSKLYTVSGPYKWTDCTGDLTVCDFRLVWFLDNPLRLSDVTKYPQLRAWYGKRQFRRTHELEPDVAQALLDEIARLNPSIRSQLRQRKNGLKSIPISTNKAMKSPRIETFEEGGIKEVTVELTRRNPQLRSRAISEYGYACKICGFNFEEHYGDIGAGYIELHHLRPLSNRKGKHEASITDVAVVCANCHRMLHRSGRTPITLDVLQRAVFEQNQR